MPVVTSAYKLYNDYITANSEAELSGQVQVLAGEDRGLYSGALESLFTSLHCIMYIFITMYMYMHNKPLLQILTLILLL